MPNLLSNYPRVFQSTYRRHYHIFFLRIQAPCTHIALSKFVASTISMIPSIQSIGTTLLKFSSRVFYKRRLCCMIYITCHISNPSCIFVYVCVYSGMALLCGKRIRRRDSCENWFLAFVEANQGTSKIFLVFLTEWNCVISIGRNARAQLIFVKCVAEITVNTMFVTVGIGQ